MGWEAGAADLPAGLVLVAFLVVLGEAAGAEATWGAAMVVVEDGVVGEDEEALSVLNVGS